MSQCGRVLCLHGVGRRRSNPSPESLRHPYRTGEVTLESRAELGRAGGATAAGPPSSPTVQADGGSTTWMGEALRLR